MAICSVSDMTAAFGKLRVEQLASDASSFGGVPTYDSSVVTALLDQAESIIAGALSRQYTLTQMTSDSAVKRYILNVAIYLLEQRRGKVSDDVGRQYQWTLDQLTQLQLGKIVLASATIVLPDIYHADGNDQLSITQSGYFDGIHDAAEQDLP